MNFTLCTEIMLYNFFFLMLVLKYLFALCAATKHTHTQIFRFFDLKKYYKTFKEDL